MSHSSPQRHHVRHLNSPQEEIISRVTEAQPKRPRNQERPQQQRERDHHPNRNEDDGNENTHVNADSTRMRSRNQPHVHSHSQSPKKLNNGTYENEVYELEEPEPFHERFEQDHNDHSPASSRHDNRGNNQNTSRNRSHSAPVSLDGKGRLGANFHLPTNHPNEREVSPRRFQRATVEYPDDEDVVPQHHNVARDSYADHPTEKRHSGSVRHSPVGSRNGDSFRDEQPKEFQEELYPSEQFIGENYNGRNSKKVSYAPDSSRIKTMSGYSQEEHQTEKRMSHSRTDLVGANDSELSCNAESCQTLRRQMLPSPKRNSLISQIPPPILQVNSVDSQSSFTCPIPPKDTDGYYNNSNNNNRSSSGPLHSSQDSMLSVGRPIAHHYSKDVLPLPIEIPENVADIQAFRRYLSVRRGALTSDRNSFEKICQTSPSSESLGGRRPGRTPMGMTPSRPQLGHEASRRTASLSHAIMTLALLSASICQLRFLITYSHTHSYPVLNYFLIFTSIILEISAGIGYVMISRCSYDDETTETIHNYLIFALFIVAVSNVILAAFAFDGHICEDLKRDANNNYAKSFSSNNAQLGLQPINRVGAVENRDMHLRYNALE